MKLAWFARVYAAGLIATLGVIFAWEALGWWGVPFGLPLAGALLVALIDDSVERARRKEATT